MNFRTKRSLVPRLPALAAESTTTKAPPGLHEAKAARFMASGVERAVRLGPIRRRHERDGFRGRLAWGATALNP